MFKYADYIYEVYKEKSFTSAAKKLFISQPALSTTIRRAEEELGFKVFERGTSPLSLTDAGKVYIASIEEMYKIERHLKNYVENIYSLNVGDISVSGAAFISSFILPKIIMEYSKRYPGIKILFIESNSLNLQEKLLSEEIEILIDYDFDEKVFETIPLKKEKILLAVPKAFEINDLFKENQLTAEDVHQDRHLEADVQSVDLSRFKDEKFIQLKAGNNMQKKGEKMCKQYGFVPQSIIKVDQLMTAYNIAASGMGIAFTTDSVVKAVSDTANLIFYKLEGKHSERILKIAYKKKAYVSPAVTAFVNVAKEIYN